MRYPSDCQRCGIHARLTYVKTASGFHKVCPPCADKMRAAGELVESERIVLKELLCKP